MGSIPVAGAKKFKPLGQYPEGQFSEIRHISKEVCRISVFADTNAALVKKMMFFYKISLNMFTTREKCDIINTLHKTE